MALAILSHSQKVGRSVPLWSKHGPRGHGQSRTGGRAAGAAGGCKAHGGPATILFLAIGLGSGRSHKVVAHNEREC